MVGAGSSRDVYVIFIAQIISAILFLALLVSQRLDFQGMYKE